MNRQQRQEYQVVRRDRDTGDCDRLTGQIESSPGAMEQLRVMRKGFPRSGNHPPKKR
jgi:hypothetical protein